MPSALVRSLWKTVKYEKKRRASIISRIAICQLGPLHYKVIVTTMIQNYLLGMPLDAFAQLCRDEGAITAYNLDGGYSSALLFNGRRLNAQERVSFRNVADIVYFASSWSGITK